jgi:hypothetical protein
LTKTICSTNHNPNQEQTMTEEQEQLIHALNGAAKAISAAVEQGDITPTQIYCLLNTLINNLVETLH